MRELVIFARFFALYFWLCRAVLCALVAIIVGNGVLFALLENQTIFSGIYFIAITALTIGYGDITPITILGKLISIVSGILGIVIMGLMVAISKLALENTARIVHLK